MELRKKISNALSGATRIAIVGIGSELRGDDFAGMLVAEAVKKDVGKSKNVGVFFGGTAPENITGEIKKFRPTHVILIDACDMCLKPGSISIIDGESDFGSSFCTHRMPLNVFIHYLSHETGAKCVLIGIQPASVAQFGCLHPSVVKSVEKISAILIEILLV